MTKKKVWQYKCGYCGKKNYAAGHMKRHEERCTMNPHRFCGMCGCHPDIDILITALGEGKTDADVDRLRGSADRCPLCMLAAIRQSGLQDPVITGVDETFGFDTVSTHQVPFEFKVEKEAWWQRVNEEAREAWGV